MARGSIIFGPSGTGKTTLGLLVAKALGYPYFDIDDYIFKVKFSEFYPRTERASRLMHDISAGTHFVMAGSMDSFHEAFDPLFDLAVFLTCDWATREARLREREFAQFGDRILPGGNLHAEHIAFLEQSQSYDSSTGSPSFAFHDAWARTLQCPVLRFDGAAPLSENLDTILRAYTKRATR